MCAALCILLLCIRICEVAKFLEVSVILSQVGMSKLVASPCLLPLACCQRGMHCYGTISNMDQAANQKCLYQIEALDGKNDFYSVSIDFLMSRCVLC